MRSVPAYHDRVSAEWVQALGKGGDVDSRLAESVADVIETLHVRPEALSGAVRRFGALLGGDGWPLDMVAQWFAESHSLVSRKQRALLTSASTTTALAAGWADAFVRGAGSDQCLDAVTGLGTAAVLRLRIAEVYAQCRSLDIAVDEAFHLVIVDSDVDDLAPFDRDAVIVTIAGLCAAVYRSGETIVRCGNRIVVLAAAAENSEIREAVLSDRLVFAPIASAARPFVWHDRLPSTLDDLEGYLRELVG
jgi:hypothetical protein